MGLLPDLSPQGTITVRFALSRKCVDAATRLTRPDWRVRWPSFDGPTGHRPDAAAQITSTRGSEASAGRAPAAVQAETMAGMRCEKSRAIDSGADWVVRDAYVCEREHLWQRDTDHDVAAASAVDSAGRMSTPACVPVPAFVACCLVPVSNANSRRNAPR